MTNMLAKPFFPLLLVILLAFAAVNAEAHYLWVSVDAKGGKHGTAKIYFEEGPTNLENPPVWQVSSGAEVTLELHNLGNLDHNWAIVELGQEVPTPYLGDEDIPGLFYWSADVVPPGETEIYTFTAPTEPGSYEVICTVPGHYPAMQGVLEVQ